MFCSVGDEILINTVSIVSKPLSQVKNDGWTNSNGAWSNANFLELREMFNPDLEIFESLDKRTCFQITNTRPSSCSNTRLNGISSTLNTSQAVIWASYQLRKTVGCACAWNAGNIFPRHQLRRKLLVSDPGMHHGTCATHVP